MLYEGIPSFIHGDLQFDNIIYNEKLNKFILIAGPCAIEDKETSFLIAEKVKALCDSLNIHYVFDKI